MAQFNKNIFGYKNVVVGQPFDQLEETANLPIKLKYQIIPPISIQTLAGKNDGVNTFHFQLPSWDPEYTPLRLYFTIEKVDSRDEDKKEIFPFFKNWILKPIKGTNYEYSLEMFELDTRGESNWGLYAQRNFKELDDLRLRNGEGLSRYSNYTFFIFGYNYEENRVYMKMRKADNELWVSLYYVLRGYFLLEKNE